MRINKTLLGLLSLGALSCTINQMDPSETGQAEMVFYANWADESETKTVA